MVAADYSNGTVVACTGSANVSFGTVVDNTAVDTAVDGLVVVALRTAVDGLVVAALRTAVDGLAVAVAALEQSVLPLWVEVPSVEALLVELEPSALEESVFPLWVEVPSVEAEPLAICTCFDEKWERSA